MLWIMYANNLPISYLNKLVTNILYGLAEIVSFRVVTD